MELVDDSGILEPVLPFRMTVRCSLEGLEIGVSSGNLTGTVDGLKGLLLKNPRGFGLLKKGFWLAKWERKRKLGFWTFWEKIASGVGF